MKPTLHLLGIPHVVADSDYAHFGFVEAIERFPAMMTHRGYKTIYYAVAGPPIPGAQRIPVMDQQYAEERKADAVNVDSQLYREFNKSLMVELGLNCAPRDIVCAPFGRAHDMALIMLPKETAVVEPLIGYQGAFANFRVYPSHSWMNWMAGKEQANGNDYHWVIPHGFDVDAYRPCTEPGHYVLYFGRIAQAKGLDIFVEMARRRPDRKFIMSGQGDPSPWLVADNIAYIGPTKPADKSSLFSGAIAVVCPTRYHEPFGVIAVEAMLHGRPVLASCFGAYHETIKEGETGYLCRTLKDWLTNLKSAEAWSENNYVHCRWDAMQRFDMYKTAKAYDAAFMQVTDLHQEGWLTL